MSNTPTLVRRSQLGELLLAEGKLSREELDAALAYREERGLKLGQALVALHLVTQQDLATALRSQGRIHCLNLTPGLVELDVARILPESMARQYVAVAVHRVAGRITVAMEDPSEEYDVAAIAVALGEPVFALHADPERILEAIGRAYPRGTVAAPPPVEAPRFTLVRGPLPESDPDEAAELLVRAALREACTIGAESFHVECTERGAEMSFRVVGQRTPAAVLATEWADACTRALMRLAGGTIDLDGESLAIEVATLESLLGPCTRVALRTLGPSLRIEDLPLEAAEHAILDSWLTAESGLVLVVGSAPANAGALASECAVRAAGAGRRVYQSDASLVRAPGSVVVRRDPRRSLADELRLAAEQAPDVVEFGSLTGSAAWSAAVDLARAGTLVLAHVDARDGSAALATMLRNVEDPTGAAAVCLGTLAARSVRTICDACHGVEADMASCTSCSGTGCTGSAAFAELLDLHGPLRSQLVPGIDADRIRAAAHALGITDLRGRARRLVDAGRTNAREIERAWKA